MFLFAINICRGLANTSGIVDHFAFVLELGPLVGHGSQ